MSYSILTAMAIPVPICTKKRFATKTVAWTARSASGRTGHPVRPIAMEHAPAPEPSTFSTIHVASHAQMIWKKRTSAIFQSFVYYHLGQPGATAPPVVGQEQEREQEHAPLSKPPNFVLSLVVIVNKLKYAPALTQTQTQTLCAHYVWIMSAHQMSVVTAIQENVSASTRAVMMEIVHRHGKCSLAMSVMQPMSVNVPMTAAITLTVAYLVRVTSSAPTIASVPMVNVCIVIMILSACQMGFATVTLVNVRCVNVILAQKQLRSVLVARSAPTKKIVGTASASIAMMYMAVMVRMSSATATLVNAPRRF